MKHPIIYIFFFVPSLLSCQFSDSPESIFDNYLYRLSNSLKVEEGAYQQQSHQQSSALMSYPSSRQLNYEIPAGNINILEFLKLSSCELQRHIGYRNSSLGRVMAPSQILVYEYEFIRLAEDCLSTLENNDANKELYNVLRTTLEHKERVLALAQWNAIFTSNEFSTLFSLGAKPLSVSSANSVPSELYAALKRIKRFVDGSDQDATSIESAYAVIASSKRIGEVRLAMQLVEQYLFLADNMLEQRLSDKPLCTQQQSNDQFAIVKTVFSKFYIGEIQPYIAHLHQQTQQLFQLIDPLADIPSAKKGFVMFWNQLYRSEGSEWNRFDRSIKSHTIHWQKLLSQCGQLPGFN